MMSSIVTPGRPNRRFSAMVVANSTGSCSTIPMSDLSHWMFKERMSWPSKVTWEWELYTVCDIILKNSNFNFCWSVLQSSRIVPFLPLGHKTFGWAGLWCSFQSHWDPQKPRFLRLWSACSGHLKSEKNMIGEWRWNLRSEKWTQRNTGWRNLPWLQAEMGRKNWHYGTQCHLSLFLTCNLLLRSNRFLVSVNVKKGMKVLTLKMHCFQSNLCLH